MRICELCGKNETYRTGNKKPDGTPYYERRCYQCVKEHGRRTVEERFFQNVDKSGDCWEWTGLKDKAGYGLFGLGTNSNVGAHRWSYGHFNGTPPGNLFVCHRCDNPSCVNPNHLFLGTHQDNMTDMVEKGRANSLKGEDSPNSTITERQAREIYNDSRSHRKIAKIYGISHSTVSAIKNKRIWKHIHAQSV